MTTAASTFATSLSASFTTIKQMLGDRGLDVSSLQDVTDDDLARMALHDNIFRVDAPSCRTRILYNLNAKFKAADVVKAMHAGVPEGIDHALLVVREPPATSSSAVDVASSDAFRSMEMFLLRELRKNISRHKLQPRWEVLGDAEVAALLRRYGLSAGAGGKNKLHVVNSTDPMARYLGLRPGQVVRITRASTSAGTMVDYRCCHAHRAPTTVAAAGRQH